MLTVPCTCPSEVRKLIVPHWICVTCGVQHADSIHPPARCAICEDERQYVGENGQRWTTLAELAESHTVVVKEEEPGLFGIGIEPPVAIGQRALLVRTASGNVLWDCIPLLDDAARARVAELGGVSAICISHPHFYGSYVEYAEAFDARVLIPRADAAWIRRPSSRVELFDDEAEPVPGVTVARIGGHFDGAAVLHWPAGSGGRGALLTGDTVQVVADRGWASFMWSYPNLIPLDVRTVEEIARRVERFRFDRVYGGWWGRVILDDGAAAVRRSADRYVKRLRGQRGPSLPVDQ
jgi:hypothetical protein